MEREASSLARWIGGRPGVARRCRLQTGLAQRELPHSQGRTGDFAVCWDTDGVDLAEIDPVFLDLSSGRAAQKRRFGGEFLPNVIEAGSGLVFAEFFQNERDGSRRGSSS